MNLCWAILLVCLDREGTFYSPPVFFTHRIYHNGYEDLAFAAIHDLIDTISSFLRCHCHDSRFHFCMCSKLFSLQSNGEAGKIRPRLRALFDVLTKKVGMTCILCFYCCCPHFTPTDEGQCYVITRKSCQTGDWKHRLRFASGNTRQADPGALGEDGISEITQICPPGSSC